MSDEQQELFEGYRPLITHNRKRNTIPAEIPKGSQCRPGQERNQTKNQPARYMPMRRLPLPVRKRVIVRRDRTAIFKAKAEAAIKRYQAKCSRDGWLAGASLHGARAKARDGHADDKGLDDQKARIRKSAVAKSISVGIARTTRHIGAEF